MILPIRAVTEFIFPADVYIAQLGRVLRQIKIWRAASSPLFII